MSGRPRGARSRFFASAPLPQYAESDHAPRLAHPDGLFAAPATTGVHGRGRPAVPGVRVAARRREPQRA